MNAVFWYCHMHSSYSADSDTPMEEMVRKAVSLGLPGICFTEHLDPDYPDTPEHLDFSLDIPSYRKAFFDLKEKYASRIPLRFGIELGLQPHLGETLSDVVRQEDFDFVIGSSHVLDHEDPYYPVFFNGKNEKDVYRRYFESELECLQAFSDFDVYGHLDYIVRYGPRKNADFRFDDHAEVLDALLEELIRKDIGLEINTGGFHYALGEPNPSSEILSRYHHLGGRIITIGADAHSPDRIAFAFDKAKDVLLRCGFREFTVFTRLKPTFYPIIP